MRKCLKRSERGFSLLEILTALAIISIVLAMAMLNYGNILPNFKANSAMDQMLYQLRSARERAISHRREVQVQFVGTNQLTITEIWLVGTAPPATTMSFEGGAQYMVFGGVPDIPAPFNFGTGATGVFFGGVTGGPPLMKFTTSGAFIDGGNTLVNGTVFMGIPGRPSTARAISILGATGRVREYHYDGTQWQE